MEICIIIPSYNEEKYIERTLNSLINQTLAPKKVVLVNDNSTDGSEEIMNAFAKAYSYISVVNTKEISQHLPGSKVINAFNVGLKHLNTSFDIICKFDADLIFPDDYLEKIATVFEENPKAGMVGGFCYIESKDTWVLENLTNKDHIRGALKAYRKECFEQIGGLKPAMGWDTVDELLAKYHKWEIQTLEGLKVKHLKPTGNTYTKAAKYKQGEAFYRLRYGFILTTIASFKLAMRKGKVSFFLDYVKGYLRAKGDKTEYLISEEAGTFVRSLRWKGIKSKIFKS